MTPEPGKLRVMVVDDERMILDVFSAMLRQAHFQSDCFLDPNDALESIRRHPKQYNLLIVDIFMPEIDGITLVKKAREINPDLPVMFMTGNASAAVKDEALKLGRVEFLEKPFPLVEKLKEIIPKFVNA